MFLGDLIWVGDVMRIIANVRGDDFRESGRKYIILINKYVHKEGMIQVYSGYPVPDTKDVKNIVDENMYHLQVIHECLHTTKKDIITIS